MRLVEELDVADMGLGMSVQLLIITVAYSISSERDCGGQSSSRYNFNRVQCTQNHIHYPVLAKVDLDCRFVVQPSTSLTI